MLCEAITDEKLMGPLNKEWKIQNRAHPKVDWPNTTCRVMKTGSPTRIYARKLSEWREGDMHAARMDKN